MKTNPLEYLRGLAGLDSHPSTVGPDQLLTWVLRITSWEGGVPLYMRTGKGGPRPPISESCCNLICKATEHTHTHTHLFGCGNCRCISITMIFSTGPLGSSVTPSMWFTAVMSPFRFRNSERKNTALTFAFCSFLPWTSPSPKVYMGF